jgi:hypothetical protein
MLTLITRALVPVAAASLLAACAANPPAAATGPVAKPVAAPAVAAAAKPAKKLNGGVDYRKIVKSGVEYFCRKETPTGSRTNATETCLTQAQMDAAQRNSKDLVERLQQVPGTPSGPGGSGGAYNSVMTK